MSWWKYAKAGERVTPLAKCMEHGPNFEIYPVFGVVYTIREIVDGICGGEDVIAIRLNEITNTVLNYPHGKCEVAFPCDQFLPVQTRSTETGMSILKSILNGADIKEGVEA
jgi:hypothetical protein